ncbi:MULTISPECIES: UPF0738 family protein [Cytobacillus]|uniref:Uncharacterized protein n=1 Tax=Cytobacillus stercorigallinarum TaxID=2762240 RepID=A0ABR8QRE7_9BACI|nr:hypothetical protein [Cytobacillus stercorigallinarum]MBD7938094.1 hypothetical protein [Cytobacillus stercorigallinarum]
MNKKVEVQSALWNDEGKELLLEIDSTLSVKDFEPREQMLVDSDHLSFIYITEKNDDYTYIMLHESLWQQLKQSLVVNGEVYLYDGKEKLKLPLFHEELQYLIENIRGNSNYGDEMVEKVEAMFE